MDRSRIFHIALLKVPGVGHGTIKNLISYCGSAESVFNTHKGKLLRIPGVGETIASAIRSTHPISAAEEELAKAEKQGVSILTYTDSDYPKRLKQIYDAPSILYVKGPANLNTIKSVAIVGTRKATQYGKKWTQSIVEALVPHECTIISGLAYGIDIEAHRASLLHSLPTVGVMASGIDTVYPSAHKNTAHKITESGALVTENPLGAKADAPKFPARNRIIAGMADLVIVIEAADKGGALITAKLAFDYDREVFAVPGSLDQPYSIGCLNLIRNQAAHVFTKIKDLEDTMGWLPHVAHNPKEKVDFSQYASPEKEILLVLSKEMEGLHIDDLSWKAQVPIHQLMATLLDLEFRGLVKPIPGKVFRILDKG